MAAENPEELAKQVREAIRPIDPPMIIQAATDQAKGRIEYTWPGLVQASSDYGDYGCLLRAASIMNVYLPRRARGVLVLVISTPFVAVGVLGLSIVGWESWYFFGGFLALGLLGMLVGFAILRLYVVVDESGITKSYWFGDGFTVSWDTIESWCILPLSMTCAQEQKFHRLWSKLYAGKPPWFSPDFGHDDSFTFRAAVFKVRGKRWPVAVRDCEAWRPSFDAFVDEVRTHVSGKEVVY